MPIKQTNPRMHQIKLLFLAGLFVMSSSLSFAVINECGNDVNASGFGTGFNGFYAPANWTTQLNGGNGTVNLTGTSAVIQGNNNLVNGVLTTVSTTVVTAGQFTFNWLWTTTDGPAFDPAFYINGSNVTLTTSGSSTQSGTVTITVAAGTTIGFGINATDGCCGFATLTINAFQWPGQCPVNECGNFVNGSGQGNGFTGYYATAEWTTNLDGGNGTAGVTTPISLQIFGNNNNVVDSQTSFTTTAVVTGTYSFTWTWTTLDSPAFDPAFFILDGIQTNLTNSSGPSQTGTFSVTINAGSVFGFGIDATDGCCGAGNVIITNFTWPGTCLPGCIDATACNFNPLATADDGSCIPGGCMDQTALNYNPNVQCDNGSCVFGLPNDVCGGAQFLDVQPGIELFQAGSNQSASTDFTTETCPGNGITVKDRWYSFVATGGNISIFSDPFLGGLHSGSIAIYESCSESPIACAPQLLFASSLIQFECGELTAGQTYYLQVGGGDEAPSLFYRIRILQLSNLAGCMDPEACNYNPLAGCDDGSCLGEQTGCTDPLSCNYDPNVCVSDPSLCIFPDCDGVCFGQSYLDDCGQCIAATYTEREVVFFFKGQAEEFIVPPLVNEIEIECYGASGGNSSIWEMNVFGTQFIPVGKTGAGGKGGKAKGTLTVTPGQSLYVVCGGSGDSSFGSNGGFNGGGNSTSSENQICTDGGGATDVRLVENDPASRVIVAGGGGGSRTSFNFDFTTVSYSLGGEGGGLEGGSGEGGGQGGSQTAGFDPNSPNGGSGGGGGWFSGDGGNTGGGGSSYIGGLQNASTIAGVNSVNGYAILRYTEVSFAHLNCSQGCTDPLATNFNSTAISDDGSCQYFGCTDPLALNFNPGATQGDNSCIYVSGCTYTDATNYNALAIKDDGSCLFNISNSCPADLNNDGLVGITDLLIFVAAYGSVCP
jgi:hypothetical protein